MLSSGLGLPEYACGWDEDLQSCNGPDVAILALIALLMGMERL